MKIQILNLKYQTKSNSAVVAKATMAKSADQNPKFQTMSRALMFLIIEYWYLRFICNLVLGYYNFTGKTKWQSRSNLIIH